jgi:cell wall-associated NlpC family hydrolase
MKKLIAISAMVLVMTTCSVASTGAEIKTSAVVTTIPLNNQVGWIVERANKQSLLEKQEAHKKQLASNTLDIQRAVGSTKEYVGKTWYVFSGSSPRGWDCSGLVLWTYEKLGVKLRHSASAQMNAGTKVKTPKYGDIVSFKYRGSNLAFHVGIYISEDAMLHSGGKRGDRTEVHSISEWAKNNGNSTIVYTRLIETN